MMVVKGTTMLNIWGTDPALINAEEFCPQCEQFNHLGHYASCPVVN